MLLSWSGGSPPHILLCHLIHTSFQLFVIVGFLESHSKWKTPGLNWGPFDCKALICLIEPLVSIRLVKIKFVILFCEDINDFKEMLTKWKSELRQLAIEVEPTPVLRMRVISRWRPCRRNLQRTSQNMLLVSWACLISSFFLPFAPLIPP